MANHHLRQRSIAFLTIALLIASVTIGYRGDDWSRYDHQTVRVVEIVSGDSLLIESRNGRQDTIKLPGIDPVDSAKPWLDANVTGHQVTLLLESPQTRDPTAPLRAFAFLGNENLSVELVKAGFAYADRREKTEMDSLIDSAESDARKKKQGLWATITTAQMPAWRQAWLKSLPPRR